MLKLLVVSTKNKKSSSIFPSPPKMVPLVPPDRWDGIIASSQWSRQSLSNFHPWLFRLRNQHVKKLRVCVCILSCIMCKIPVFYHDLTWFLFWIYVYIYTYCIYPDVPMNCDDLAEVKDMPMSLSPEMIGHLGRVFYNQNAGCSIVFAVAALVCV